MLRENDRRIANSLSGRRQPDFEGMGLALRTRELEARAREPNGAVQEEIEQDILERRAHLQKRVGELEELRGVIRASSDLLEGGHVEGIRYSQADLKRMGKELDREISTHKTSIRGLSENLREFEEDLDPKVMRKIFGKEG